MSEKMFPIMGGPAIPWRLIAPYENQAIKNHDQTLERLAQRGGLDYREALLIIEGRPLKDYHKRTNTEASILLRDFLKKDDDAQACKEWVVDYGEIMLQPLSDKWSLDQVRQASDALQSILARIEGKE